MLPPRFWSRSETAVSQDRPPPQPEANASLSRSDTVFVCPATLHDLAHDANPLPAGRTTSTPPPPPCIRRGARLTALLKCGSASQRRPATAGAPTLSLASAPLFHRSPGSCASLDYETDQLASDEILYRNSVDLLAMLKHGSLDECSPDLAPAASPVSSASLDGSASSVYPTEGFRSGAVSPVDLPRHGCLGPPAALALAELLCSPSSWSDDGCHEHGYASSNATGPDRGAICPTPPPYFTDGVRDEADDDMKDLTLDHATSRSSSRPRNASLPCLSTTSCPAILDTDRPRSGLMARPSTCPIDEPATGNEPLRPFSAMSWPRRSRHPVAPGHHHHHLHLRNIGRASARLGRRLGQTASLCAGRLRDLVWDRFTVWRA